MSKGNRKTDVFGSGQKEGGSLNQGQKEGGSLDWDRRRAEPLNVPVSLEGLIKICEMKE